MRNSYVAVLDTDERVPHALERGAASRPHDPVAAAERRQLQDRLIPVEPGERALNDLAAGRLQVELGVDEVPPALLSALAELGVTVSEPSSALALSAAPVTLLLTVPDEDQLPAIAERTLASGARLYALTPRRATLEQLFLDIVGTEDSGQ